MAYFEKYSFRESDIREQVMPDGTVKKRMHRFVTAPDLSHRGGFTRITKDTPYRSFLWYDEYWCVFQGTGNVVATDRASGEQKAVTIQARDAIFVGMGTHLAAECTSDEPLLFMYVAVPVSMKVGKWLAHVTPDDIADVRSRMEFDWEWPWGPHIRDQSPPEMQKKP
jgi:hypothetical protein